MTLPRIDHDQVHSTIERLGKRIEARFPGSGLSSVCVQLLAISERSRATTQWIEKPNTIVRVVVAVVVLLLLGLIVAATREIHLDMKNLTLNDLVQTVEAATNELALIGAAVYFLTRYEKTIKRHRILQSVNDLRCLVHLIDLHQLTKDPYVYRYQGELKANKSTKKDDPTPERLLSPLELNRYLDYCTEMLSLTTKVAFLYIQNFDDEICTETINDLEALSGGMSQKIWQKINALP
jgi:hypothetical protein